MDFYYLLLGHLLGDFTFQTNKIAENKSRNLKWILLHTLIVTSIMLIISIPFGSRLMFLVLLNGIAHFLIDYYKSLINAKKSVLSFIYFLIDQTLHLLMIYIISLINVDEYSTLPFDKRTIIILITLVFIISFSAVFIQYFLKVFFPKNSNNFFTNNERAIGNIIRILTFIICYLSFNYLPAILFLLPLLVLTTWQLYQKNWKKWMTKSYFYTKIILDIGMALIGLSFVLSI